MELENQALETEIENGGQGSVVDSQEEGTGREQAGSAGASVEQEELGAAARGQQQEAQSRKDNAAARAARIRAEQETTARLQKQYDEQIAGLGIPNPYTGKPFRSFQEFREYGETYRKEKLEAEAQRQGRTVEDLQEEEENRSWLARKRQEEKAQKEALAALNDRKAFVAADLEAFVKNFPDVDPGKLEQNPKFRKFAGKRLYKEPLSELYADFVDLVSDTERAAVEKAAGKAQRSTGGAQGGGTDQLTPAQRAALAEWNRDNPELKMTAKEFLSL